MDDSSPESRNQSASSSSSQPSNNSDFPPSRGGEDLGPSLPYSPTTPFSISGGTLDRPSPLPSVENLLPYHIFEQLLSRNPGVPGAWESLSRPQIHTAPLVSDGTSQPSTTQSTSLFRLLPQLSSPPTSAFKGLTLAPYNSHTLTSRHRSLSAPAGSIGAPLILGDHETMAVDGDYNEANAPSNILLAPTLQEYVLDDEQDSHQFVHWPQRGSGMSNRWRARSSSPINHTGQASFHLSSSRRPKTRKVWTEFEREAIREYCQWLLSTPAFRGQSVLPSDLDTWEAIKNALWARYPRRFQRSRKGIMELARRMGLRQSMREDLQTRQDHPMQGGISRSLSAEI